MNRNRPWIALFILIYLMVLILNTWASDDAFITLRVVDNILHGYGPRWNGAERVQVFTHPLWMMMLIPFYGLIQNPFFALYLACGILSLATISFLFLKFSPSPWIGTIVTAVLISSKAFMDYSSSGMENPLSHLLVILFAWAFLRDHFPTRGRILLLSLMASLATLNRMDTVLLFVPALLLEVWRERVEIWKALGSVFLGFLPLFLWEVFSLIYYGFPFPNTYYAKLTTGIPQSDLYYQGWIYFINSFRWDHITLPIIGLTCLISLLRREQKAISLVMGILLYLAYILRIGGDFMSGRFFSTPFILAVTLLLISTSHIVSKLTPAAASASIGIILLFGLTSTESPLLIYQQMHTTRTEWIDESGIADEKMAYFQCCSLVKQWSSKKLLPIAAKARMDRNKKTKLVIRKSTGIYGFYAGPDVYILDIVCLGDPLRAHLPVNGEWRIGHFERHYPVGYTETIENDFHNQIREPHLHEYYDKLLIITRGKLFSPERLQVIMDLNLGKYNYLLDEYVQSQDWEK